MNTTPVITNTTPVITNTTPGTRVEVATLHRPACTGRVVSHDPAANTVTVTWRARDASGRMATWRDVFTVETGEPATTAWGIIGMM